MLDAKPCESSLLQSDQDRWRAYWTTYHRHSLSLRAPE